MSRSQIAGKNAVNINRRAAAESDLVKVNGQKDFAGAGFAANDLEIMNIGWHTSPHFLQCPQATLLQFVESISQKHS